MTKHKLPNKPAIVKIYWNNGERLLIKRQSRQSDRLANTISYASTVRLFRILDRMQRKNMTYTCGEVQGDEDNSS